MNLVVALVVLLLALSLLALFLALASEPFVGKAYLGVTTLALAVAVLPPLLIPFDVFITSNILRQTAGPNAEYYQRLIEQSYHLLFGINFILSWAVLPIVRQFQAGGELLFVRRLLKAVSRRLKLYLAFTAAALAYLCYLLYLYRLDLQRVADALPVVGNFLAQFWNILLLGYGLSAFPKQALLKARPEEFNRSVEQQLRGVTRSIQLFQVDLQLSESKLQFLRESEARLGQIIDQFVPRTSARADRVDLPSSPGLEDCEAAIRQHKKIQGTLSRLRGRSEELAHTRARFPGLYWGLFGLSLLLSAVIVLSQFAIFLPALEQANPFVRIGEGSFWTIAIASYSVLGFMVACALYSLTKIKFPGRYRIAVPRGTDQASLLFFAGNISRLVFPMCCNFLEMIGLSASALNRFAGVVELGRLRLIFPGLLLVAFAINILNLWDRLLRRLGADNYAFQQQQQPEKRGRLLEIV